MAPNLIAANALNVITKEAATGAKAINGTDKATAPAVIAFIGPGKPLKVSTALETTSTIFSSAGYNESVRVTNIS